MKKDFKKLLSLALSAVMMAATLPMSALAADATKAVKEDIDWENWLIPGAEYSSYLDGATCYVGYDANGGPTNGDNDYHWWCGGAGNWSLVINDPGYGNGEGAIATKTYLSDGAGGSVLSDIPTSDGVLWGFKGSKYYTGWMADNSVREDFPADRWLGVKDISAHEDTGYAVFTIESVSGDAKNAYLAIKVATDPWMIGLNDYTDLPVTKEAYEKQLEWKEPYMSFVLGAKLTDYYNVSKGGKQTVAVPLSKLTNSPDFKEMYSKVSNTTPAEFQNKLANFPIDLRLFGGMGIARKDSGKKQAFTAVVSDLAIVNPATPTNVVVEQAGEDVAVVFDKTTDEDVTYKVIKTCNGVKEYIDAPECAIEDVIDPSLSYMYQVVAVDNKYGVMSVPSEAFFIGAEGVDIEKDNVDWKNWVGTTESDFWMNYLEGEVYYTGEVSEWNDYAGYTYRAGQNLLFNIDDSNAGTTMHINTQMLKTFGDLSSKVSVPTVRGAWGYVGANYSKFRQYGGSQPPVYVPADSKVPADKWLGVKDISDYKDGGYAVFTIESVTGDGADEAYLAITAATDIWQLGLDESYSLPITKAEHVNTAWVDSHYLTAVNGAKLTDYYDVSKGGKQTVAVPLSKLVDDPDFLEIKAKEYNALANKVNPENFQWYKTNLQLYSGMGIARRDAAKAKTFSATVSEMKIVALQTPTNLVGTENEDGSVSFTFATTNDTDVAFKIARTVDGVTTYFDAPGGAFTDSGMNPKKEYVYQAVAYNEEYDIYSAGSNSFVLAPDYVSVIRDNVDWKNWVSPAGWNNYLESTVYYTGDRLNEWNDYKGAYCGGLDMKAIIDDSNSGTEWHINTKMLEFVGNASSDTEIPTRDGAWGYTGLNYDNFRQMIPEGKKDNIPADKWLGVKSIADYKDNGYAVFTVESITGDGADNAYFAITSVPNVWKIPGLAVTGANLPISKAETADAEWTQEHYETFVNGAKLTDYYDVSKGGRQTVIIPLSKLVDDPDFFEARSKDYNAVKSWAEAEDAKADLHLFSGMGIARRDAESKKTFSATVSEMKIVAVEAPIDFDAVVNEDGSVTATFETTFDKEVEYKVVRTSGSEVKYFDAPNGTYTDTTRDVSKTYKYSAVAVYDDLGIETESENVVTIESEVTNYIKLYAGDVETKYAKEGIMTAKYFTSAGDATGYIARYDQEGRLLGANLVAVPASVEKSASLDVEAGNTVKVMLWADGEAVVDAIVAGEKPMTVLVIGDEGAVDATCYFDSFINEDISLQQIWGENLTIADHANDIEAYLAEDEWDYIFIQEDMEAVLDDCAYVGFDAIANAIADMEPNASIYVIDGWFYDPDVTGIDPETMFADVADIPVNVAEKATVISTSLAIYMAAYEFGLDVWAEDGKGLNDLGSYIANLLVYRDVIGGDLNDLYAPSGVDKAAAIEVVSAI